MAAGRRALGTPGLRWLNRQWTGWTGLDGGLPWLWLPGAGTLGDQAWTTPPEHGLHGRAGEDPDWLLGEHPPPSLPDTARSKLPRLRQSSSTKVLARTGGQSGELQHLPRLPRSAPARHGRQQWSSQ